MNISTLNNDQKKRLLSDLINDDEDTKKRQKYKFKYPEFNQALSYYEFIIQELNSNVNKNNKIIENLEDGNIESVEETIKNIKEHNIKITNNIKFIESQITKHKFNFQDLCVHNWITNYDYKFKTHTGLTKSYSQCDDSDIEEIKKCNGKYPYNNKYPDIDVSNWEKKLVNTNFKEYDCYDREIYIKCKTCEYRHTINFYSK